MHFILMNPQEQNIPEIANFKVVIPVITSKNRAEAFSKNPGSQFSSLLYDISPQYQLLNHFSINLLFCIINNQKYCSTNISSSLRQNQ